MNLRHPAAAIIAVTVVVEVVMVLAGTEPNLLLVAGLVGLVGTTIWCLVDLRAATTDPDPQPVAYRPPPDARADQRVRMLRNGLVFGSRSGNDHAAQRLRDGLVELVDDQLLAEYGVDRHADPAAAESIIGAELFRFVEDTGAADSARVVSRPKHLAHIVTLIEEI